MLNITKQYMNKGISGRTYEKTGYVISSYSILRLTNTHQKKHVFHTERLSPQQYLLLPVCYLRGIQLSLKNRNTKNCNIYTF